MGQQHLVMSFASRDDYMNQAAGAMCIDAADLVPIVELFFQEAFVNLATVQQNKMEIEATTRGVRTCSRGCLPNRCPEFTTGCGGWFKTGIVKCVDGPDN